MDVTAGAYSEPHVVENLGVLFAFEQECDLLCNYIIIPLSPSQLLPVGFNTLAKTNNYLFQGGSRFLGASTSLDVRLENVYFCLTPVHVLISSRGVLLPGPLRVEIYLQLQNLLLCFTFDSVSSVVSVSCPCWADCPSQRPRLPLPAAHTPGQSSGSVLARRASSFS